MTATASAGTAVARSVARGRGILHPIRVCSVAARVWRLGRLGSREAGRRPALVWPFGVRANAGERVPFALTLRAPEDDPPRRHA